VINSLNKRIEIGLGLSIFYGIILKFVKDWHYVSRLDKFRHLKNES